MTSTTHVVSGLQEIVNAVLYEGHILYPHRAPAPRNQHNRFSFGRICPEIYNQNQAGQELCQFQTEVLLETGGELPELRITLGFLQPVQQEICALRGPLPKLPPGVGPASGDIPKLETNGRVYQSWMEAVERQVTVPLKTFHGSVEAIFNFDDPCVAESIFDETGQTAAIVRSAKSPISGKVIVALTPLKHGLSKISVTILNQSWVADSGADVRDNFLMSTMASSHVILQAKHGRFISLWDTPAELKFFAAQCRNVGIRPVLVGDKSQDKRSAMMASPIILYDYPQISGENNERLTGGAEPEQHELRAGDYFSWLLEPNRVMDSNDSPEIESSALKIHFSNEEFFNPTKSVKSVLIDGVELSAGDRVCIHPSCPTEGMDLILAGKTAIIEALEQDVDGQIHLGLALEGDSQGYLDAVRQSGYRFFYPANEVWPCKREVAS